jgi:hypothetical protein
MSTRHIRVNARSAAAPAAVFALVRDGATWPRVSELGSFELAEPAPDGTEGVGALRVFRTRTLGRTYVSRERIVELEPDRRFAYELASGLSLRGYRAEIDLEPLEDRGTELRMHSSFSAKVPGTGWVYQRRLADLLRGLAEGLAAAAAQSSGGAQEASGAI